MAQKSKTRQPKNRKDRIADATLELAGRQGWSSLALQEIARKSHTPLAALKRDFSDIYAILDFVLERHDEQSQKAVNKHLGDNWRDNLMEIVMVRLELAQRHRKAFLALPSYIAARPEKIKTFTKRFYCTAADMLELSGAPAKGSLGSAAFGAAYLCIVHAWMQDDTADLSKTMSAVDRHLTIFERGIEYLGCTSRTEYE